MNSEHDVIFHNEDDLKWVEMRGRRAPEKTGAKTMEAFQSDEQKANKEKNRNEIWEKAKRALIGVAAAAAVTAMVFAGNALSSNEPGMGETLNKEQWESAVQRQLEEDYLDRNAEVYYEEEGSSLVTITSLNVHYNMWDDDNDGRFDRGSKSSASGSTDFKSAEGGLTVQGVKYKLDHNIPR